MSDLISMAVKVLTRQINTKDGYNKEDYHLLECAKTAALISIAEELYLIGQQDKEKECPICPDCGFPMVKTYIEIKK